MKSQVILTIEHGETTDELQRLFEAGQSGYINGMRYEIVAAEVRVDIRTIDDIVDSLPEGYRWATTDETDNWNALSKRMVQVRVGGTDDEPLTDIAIRE